MRLARLLVAVGAGIASTGALAETGVNVGDIGYVANVYGRTPASYVMTAGPLITRPADATVVGRESAQGPSEISVKLKDREADAVFGRA
jgi:hypothetical protein